MSKLKNLKRYRQTEPEDWEQRASGIVPKSRPSGTSTIPPVKPKHMLKTPYQNWLVPGIVVLVLLSMIGFVVKVFLSSSDGPKKAMYQVTMIKHVPPDEKVKPPEPEQPKELPKETIPTATEIPQPEAQDQTPADAPPAGADLGVAGEGGAGSDGFGLVGKGKNYKGRDITLGSGGGSGMSRLALLTKYGWYTQKLQEEVKKQMRKRLDQDGGIPKGKHQAVVKIVLDAGGTIVNYQIVASSGNSRMDEALKNSLPGFRVSKPLPDGMPASMTVRISSQG